MTERYTPEQLNEAAVFHQSMIDKGTLDHAAHDVLFAMLRQAASDAARIAELEADAERWRWLVSENNKGGSRAKFLICWWSKVADGYETTNGTSIDGKDEQAIVRLIDAARSRL